MMNSFFRPGSHPHGVLINPNNQMYMDQNIPSHSNKMVLYCILMLEIRILDITYFIIIFLILEEFIIEFDVSSKSQTRTYGSNR